MNRKDPVFWTAYRIHRVLSSLPRSSSLWQIHSAAQDLGQELAVLERVNHLLRRAASLSWARHCAVVLQQRVLAAGARVSAASAAVLARGDASTATPLLPGIPDLVDDLRQLHAEFNRVTLEPRSGGRIVAVTPPITLEEIELGRFEIQLDLKHLPDRMDASAFRIKALDPNPTGSSDDVTHPHVKDEQLCAGDATVPIAQALAQGRITDAFCLVSAVLHTYNPQSAYVGLDDWSGPSCGDCGNRATRGEIYSCDACGGDFCDRCTNCCIRCDSSFCMSCLSEDADADLICRDCACTCRTCGGRAEATALRRQDGQCASCAADEEDDDDAEGDTDSAEAETDPQNVPRVVPASAGPSPSPIPDLLPETSHEHAEFDPYGHTPPITTTAIASAAVEHRSGEAITPAGSFTFDAGGEPIAPQGAVASVV